MSKKSASQLPKYLIISTMLLGLGAVFALSISEKLGSNSSEDTIKADSENNLEAVETASLEGRQAPGFNLSNLQGEPVNLADYRGKIVFLNFWATWCEPCKEEMPSMQRLYAKMQGRPFEILAISLDVDPLQAVPIFLEQTHFKIDFPILQDTEQLASKNLYKTTGVPESFIIGADGKVLKHVIGSYEWDSEPIVEYFEKLFQDASVL